MIIRLVVTRHGELDTETVIVSRHDELDVETVIV
jgi:hypothetical protein